MSEWKIVDHPDIPGMILIEGPAFRLVICAQASNITASDYLAIMADARLVAAAPEMYEALQMFLAYNDQGAPLSFDTDTMWAKARSVVAKIEGGGE